MMIRLKRDPSNDTIMLCKSFYDHMRYNRKGVTHFAEAITWLENVEDPKENISVSDAVMLIEHAIKIAYGDVPV